jgi:hypothetical protein
MSDLKLSHSSRDRMAAFVSGHLDPMGAEDIGAQWLDNSQGLH